MTLYDLEKTLEQIEQIQIMMTIDRAVDKQAAMSLINDKILESQTMVNELLEKLESRNKK